jgi:hypothetical protein
VFILVIVLSDNAQGNFVKWLVDVSYISGVILALCVHFIHWITEHIKQMSIRGAVNRTRDSSHIDRKQNLQSFVHTVNFLIEGLVWIGKTEAYCMYFINVQVLLHVGILSKEKLQCSDGWPPQVAAMLLEVTDANCRNVSCIISNNLKILKQQRKHSMHQHRYSV